MTKGRFVMKRWLVIEAALFLAAFGFSMSQAKACDDHKNGHAKSKAQVTQSGVVLASASQVAPAKSASAITDRSAEVTKEPVVEAKSETQAQAETKAETDSDSETSMEKELVRLGNEINALTEKAMKATGKAQVTLQEKLKGLEANRTRMMEELRSTSKTSGRALSKMQSGLEKAFAELMVGFGEAREEWNKAQAEAASDKTQKTPEQSTKKNKE